MEAADCDGLIPICLTIFVLFFILWVVGMDKGVGRRYSRAKDYQDAGDLELAIAEYTKIIEEYSKVGGGFGSAEAHLYRGEAYQAKGDLEQAIEDFERYILLTSNALTTNDVKRREVTNRIEQLKSELEP